MSQSEPTRLHSGIFEDSLSLDLKLWECDMENMNSKMKIREGNSKTILWIASERLKNISV